MRAFACVILAALTAACAPSDKAPDFRLADTGGRVVRLSEYRGQVVLLNFWATWCQECDREFPVLERLQQRLKGRRVSILAASIDDSGRKAVLPYLAQRKITIPILLADPASIRSYGVAGLPASFLIDRAGRIAKKYAGAVDLATLENDILGLLKEIP